MLRCALRSLPLGAHASALALGASLALGSAPAAAQPADPPLPAAPAAPAAPAPRPTTGAPPGAGQQRAPRPGVDDDAMLPPVPPATTVLRTWREALAYVASRDADYQTAILEIDRLDGLERTQLAGALPTLTATGQVVFQIIRAEGRQFDPAVGGIVNTLVPPSPVGTAQLTLRQPLLAPRTWYGVGTAERQTEIARLSAEDRRRLLVATVADAIVAVVTAERVAEVNRVGLRAALERLSLQKRRVELGSGTALDVVRFEQDVAIARATLINGDESLRQSRERLGLSLGTADAVSVAQNISLDAIQEEAKKTCAPAPVADRADLRALRAQREVAERQTTDADLQYLPTAELSSTFTYSSFPLSTTYNYGWTVTGLLSVPIWDGGARYGNQRSTSAVLEQSEQRLAAATRTAEIEIRRAERGVDVGQRALEVAKTTRDLAAETERLAQLAFDAGSGTSFDLVDASRRLREAELSLALRELELVRARITGLLSAASCDY